MVIDRFMWTYYICKYFSLRFYDSNNTVDDIFFIDFFWYCEKNKILKHVDDFDCLFMFFSSNGKS